jgi:hypothetical protein
MGTPKLRNNYEKCKECKDLINYKTRDFIVCAVINEDIDKIDICPRWNGMMKDGKK